MEGKRCIGIGDNYITLFLLSGDLCLVTIIKMKFKNFTSVSLSLSDFEKILKDNHFINHSDSYIEEIEEDNFEDHIIFDIQGFDHQVEYKFMIEIDEHRFTRVDQCLIYLLTNVVDIWCKVDYDKDYIILYFANRMSMERDLLKVLFTDDVINSTGSLDDASIQEIKSIHEYK